MHFNVGSGELDVLLRQFCTLVVLTVHFDTVRFDTVRFDTVRFDTVCFDTVRFDTVHFDTAYFENMRLSMCILSLSLILAILWLPFSALWCQKELSSKQYAPLAAASKAYCSSLNSFSGTSMLKKANLKIARIKDRCGNI